MALEVTWQSNPSEKLLKERFHISTGFHPGQRQFIRSQLHGRLIQTISKGKTDGK